MDKHHITIQQATITDADTLLTLSRETFFHFFAHLNDPANMEAYASKAFTPQKTQAELSNPNSSFYFAMLDGQITGYMKINFGPAQTELQDNQALEVERIYVLAEYHGKKIGHQLLDFALQTAKDQELKYVWLGVWEHNLKAIGFYEKHGFKVFGSHDFMLGSDQQTDLLMKRELS
ncbi:MAG: paiA 2 [Mucilaginibacter sp.]|nr:paiA 2 [Mucilaginibacter sp.]